MIDRLKLKEDARYMRKGYCFKLLYPLVFNIIAALVIGVVETLGLISEKHYLITSIVDLIASWASIIFTYLACAYFRDFVKNKVPNNKGFFKPIKSFSHAVKVIVANILVGLIVTLGFILLIVPGIIWSLSYSQVNFILGEKKDISISEALRLSKMMMSGRKWEYFSLLFSFIGWILLGILTCGILYFWLYSYISTAQALYYEELKVNYNQFYPGTFEDDSTIIVGDDGELSSPIDDSSSDMFS